MTKLSTLRIFTLGGIITPEELRKITQVARLAGCSHLMPGSRQEWYLQVEEKHLLRAEKELKEGEISFMHLENKSSNIVTSFAAHAILPSTAWLFGDTYLDILDSFTYQPSLKINIVDPLQNLVPLFTGELNFIASTYPAYWYLYVHFSKFGKRQLWPFLIEGEDISRLSRLIEEVYSLNSTHTVEELYGQVSERFSGKSRPIDQELLLQEQGFPQIEGVHKTGNAYWLGIYRRNFTFPLDFLEALQRLFVQTKIGKICLTPHKTILIKDIREKDLVHWEKMLGLHGINLRHSSLELNWQLPDLNQQALKLKNTLVQALEEREISTTGLSFALLTQPAEVATCVRIEQHFDTGDSSAASDYTILHTVDFSVHHTQWIKFADRVGSQELVDSLINLCRMYYEQPSTAIVGSPQEEPIVLSQPHTLYQCRDCLTVYDPLYGDNWTGKDAAVPFDELPQEYTCSTCDAPKANFILLEGHEYKV
jgi:rubredoxin